MSEEVFKQQEETAAAGMFASGLYRQMIDNLPGGIVVLEGNSFTLLYGNRSFSDITGYSNEDLKSGNVRFPQLLAEDMVACFSEELAHLREHNTVNRKYKICNIRTARNTWTRQYVYMSRLKDEVGAEYIQLALMPEWSQWSLPFISYDTREMFLELFSSFGFGTFEWQTTEDKLLWSDSVYDIYETDKSQPISYQYVTSLHHPEDRAMAAAAVQKTLNTGEPFDYVVRIITPRRNLKYINSIGKLVKDSNNGHMKLVGSVRDITLVKEGDMAQKRHLSELNRSNKELEEFAYITSHDLQEPLRKVSTFSDRLYDKIFEELDQDGKFYLQRIMASASNMRQLINNLLDFSRVTKGNFTFSETDLSFILREVKSDLELKISESEVVIENEPLPLIEADPLQMRQLFLNLLGNAIKFRKEHEPARIKITCRLLDEDEKVYHNIMEPLPYYRLQFIDNGIGFEEEYATRIFQIFQRLHGKAEYPGSGMGLAICKKIVDHHQGLIYAESKPGEGATFTIVLPQQQY